jgi:hypothetical protein
MERVAESGAFSPSPCLLVSRPPLVRPYGAIFDAVSLKGPSPAEPTA